MTFTRNTGLLLAGIWFVLTGLIALFSLSISWLPLIMGLLALIAGVLLIIGK